MTREELAWLAGLLEGEGSFFLVKKKSGRSYPRVSLNMTDEDVIERAANLLGRGHYPFPRKPPRKEQFALQIEGRGAVVLMEEILLFMGLRRSAQLNELIKYHYENAAYKQRKGEHNSQAKQKTS